MDNGFRDIFCRILLLLKAHQVLISLQDSVHDEGSVTVSVLAPLLHHSAPESLSHNLPVPFLKEIQSLQKYLITSHQ